VLGTNGRSIWILDDLTPLRTFKKGTQLFSVQPAIRWRYHEEIHEDKEAGKNPPQGAIINYHLEGKAKGDLTMLILDAKGKLIQKLSSKKAEEVKEDDPDAGDGYKKTVLTNEAGVNRVIWDLRFAGAKIIPGAKNDGGIPQRGPFVLPGNYTIILNVDGKMLTGTVQVLMDPRVKEPIKNLEDSLRMTLKVRDDISRISEMVIRLKKIRSQLQSRDDMLKDNAKAKPLVKQAKALITKIDVLEGKLHNPKAEVTYDILAQGVRLYSKITSLYEWLKDSDGPITQGMREVYADYTKEIAQLATEYQAVLGDLTRLNEAARMLEIPNIIE